MSVKDDIIRFLEKQGGEFRAPEGNAGKLIAKKVGHRYENVSTTLHRMVKAGLVEKEGDHQRRAYGYRLLRRPEPSPGAIPPAEQAVPSIPRHLTPERAQAVLRDLGASNYGELAMALLSIAAMGQGRHEEAGAPALTEQLRQLQESDERHRGRAADLRRQLGETRRLLHDIDVRLFGMEQELAALENARQPYPPLSGSDEAG